MKNIPMFWIALIPSFIMIIGLVIGFIKRIYIRKGLQWIFFYLCLGVVAQFIQHFLWPGKPKNNLYLYHFYTPLEFIFLSLFYQYILRKELHKAIFITISILFLATAVYFSMYLQGLQSFNTYARFAESLILLGYSIIYLMKTIPKIDTIREFQENNNNFAIVTGICLYFLGSFLILSLSNSVLKFGDIAFNYLMWILHIVFLIVLYTAINIGIWITPASRQKYHFTSPLS
jgi:hypothetical protein